MTDTLPQRVQAAVRDALATTRNPGAGLDVSAAFIASAVLAEVHRQPAVVEPPADQTADDPRAQLLDALDFSYCQGLGYNTPEELLAAYDASRAPAIPSKSDTAAGDESPHVYMDAVQDSAAWAHAFTKAGQMTEALEHVEAIERLLAVYRRAVGVQDGATP